MKDFLQTKEWRDFQKSFGRKTFFLNEEGVEASVIEHQLPVVGKYLYIPRGINLQPASPSGGFPIFNDKISKFLNKVFNLAQEERAGWIRLDISSKDYLNLLKENPALKIKKSPHDMQPREIFVVDISSSEEEILAAMKSKTRYNIRLAEKKGVVIEEGREHLKDFLRLTKVMAKRQGITPHPDEYYQKMTEVLPENILKIYVAKYQNKIIAADLIIFYEDMAIYLHGASEDAYRNVMAPYLLKWQEMLIAKKKGCQKFDLGGVKTKDKNGSWQGITRFKLGFAKETQPIRFLGSYDIIVNRGKYFLYRLIQRIKSL